MEAQVRRDGNDRHASGGDISLAGCLLSAVAYVMLTNPDALMDCMKKHEPKYIGIREKETKE